MPHFSYSSAGKPISASIIKEQGPGWVAKIEGQHEVSNGMSNELSILWLIIIFMITVNYSMRIF